MLTEELKQDVRTAELAVREAIEAAAAAQKVARLASAEALEATARAASAAASARNEGSFLLEEVRYNVFRFKLAWSDGVGWRKAR